MNHSKQPAWLDNAVFYEIYPQSFYDTNADGIGDFQGIIDKLDYIADLGCNAIWLNPCFASPFGDAGYDVSDYYTAAPRYGTNADLKRLFDAVHKRDMHLLLDLVPGHTSVEHKWFQESMKAEKNEYTDRYVWTDSVWEEPQGMGCLRGISARDGSCAINFFSNQPALNYGFYNPRRPWQQSMDDEGPKATLAELKNIMRFWLQMGCDGFRVDMEGSNGLRRLPCGYGRLPCQTRRGRQRNHQTVAEYKGFSRQRVSGCRHGFRVGRAGQIPCRRLPYGLSAPFWFFPLQCAVSL